MELTRDPDRFPAGAGIDLLPARICHAVEGCGIVRLVMNPRGPLSLRRMSAHWVVLAAAALTTLVAAAVGGGPGRVRRPGAPAGGQARPGGRAGHVDGRLGHVRGRQPGPDLGRAAVDHRRDAGRRAVRLLAGHLVRPARLRGRVAARQAGQRVDNTPLLQAASLQGITDHAVLVSGRWPSQAAALGRRPGRAAGGAIPAALPASAAALLGLHRRRPPRGGPGLRRGGDVPAHRPVRGAADVGPAPTRTGS